MKFHRYNIHKSIKIRQVRKLRKAFLHISTLMMILMTALFCDITETFAVTRGELVQEIIKTLKIPYWEGERYFADIPPKHPYKAAAETALALGIILPNETFYPDLEATNAEAIFFALRAMGLRHEAQIMEKLASAKNSFDVPDYIFPYYLIAENITPALPKSTLLRPKDTLTQGSLYQLLQWLRDCMTGLVWEKTFLGEKSSLILHRENIGTPPTGWIVSVEGQFNPSDIKTLEKSLSSQELKISSETTTMGERITVGPFIHFAKAWEAVGKINQILNKEAKIESYKTQESQALFWAAVRFLPQETSPKIITAGEIAGKRLPISWIAQNTGAECAINGGFFNKTKIIGSLIIRGIPVSNPYGTRSAIGWDAKGNICFSRGDFKAKVTVENIDIPIDSFNEMKDHHQVALFTPHLWYYATPIPSDAMEFVIRAGRITEERYSHLSNHLVPKDGYLLVARGRYASVLRQIPKPIDIKLVVQMADERLNDVSYLLQAGPMILKDGVFWSNNEGFSANTLLERHPRTIVGYDGAYLYWLIIDGRDPWHSRGVTLKEAATIAKKLGCHNALNLDGGGSSALWWQGNIINKPSGNIERPVPYALIF